MDLPEEIIQAALADRNSVSNLLRKCLVLAHDLQNNSLETWVKMELNGYPEKKDLPSYRKISAPAKGLFIGSFIRQINNQPIPSAILNKEDRHFAETAFLTEPIAAYERFISNQEEGKSLSIPWPANLVVKYQAAFFDGDMALNRAWQEFSTAALVSIVDVVKTKILTLALEIRRELGKTTSHKIADLPAAKLESHVTNIIYGNVITGTTGDILIQSVKIQAGDFNSLKKSLLHLGIGENEIVELDKILKLEARLTKESKSLGKKTSDWIVKASKGLAKAGLQIGQDVVKAEIFKYLGLTI